MSQDAGQQGGQQTGQQSGQQTGQQAPPDWYTNPPAWLRTPPPPQQHQGTHTGGQDSLVAEIQAMPEKVVRALQDAITAATTQQQNTGQQNSGQQNSGQQNSGQQNSGQQTEQTGGDNTPAQPKTFGERWFAQQ